MHMSRLVLLFFCFLLTGLPYAAFADQRTDPREQALSDTLDLWREGKFELLYDTLSHRSSMSRERFAAQLRENTVKPACCHQKLNDFRLISEKRTTSKIYARIGIEGLSGSATHQSREFTLDHEEGRWKVRLSDLKALAGEAGSKKKKK